MNSIQMEEGQGKLFYDISEERAEGLMSLRMLEYNKIQGLLPLYQQHVDDSLRLSYEIRGKISLKKQYEHKVISVKRACQLIRMVIDIILTGEQYFLLPEEYCVDFSHIYLDRGQKQLYLCYLPAIEQDFRKEFRRLLECFMEQLDHKNKQEISFYYAFYDMYCAGELSLIELAEHIRQFEQENGGLTEEKVFDSKKITEQGEKSADGVAAKEREREAEYVFSLYQAHLPLFRKKMIWTEILPKQFFCSEGKYPVGRQEGSTVHLLPGQISRKHAEIEITEGQAYITDQGSRNGTYVNERRLSAYVKTRLQSGDIIRFANISYRLENLLSR